MQPTFLRTALLAAGTLMLGAVSASAQDYNRNDDVDATYLYGSSENLQITTPPYGPSRSELGAPYKLTSLSKEVRFDDLNLRTRHGVRVLRNRIQITARLLCRDLDERYPVTADNSPPCYKNAVEEANYSADRAIADARNYRD